MGSKGVGATVANDEFFQRRQAAAVLKHGVVQRYSTVFTTMTSTDSSGRRVVYLDGYAGRGGYEDGTPGSPLLALETARAVAGWDRHVESVFVEADRASYLELTKRLQEAATDGTPWRVRHGDVVEHLDETLELARGLPLLAFLDPFGTALPFDALVERILNRHETAPTEVLLNLNIDLVRRWGGLLDLETRNIGQETILARLDRFFGDSWWRDVYLDTRGGDSALAASQAALAVVDTFHERIRARTGHGAVGQSHFRDIRANPGSGARQTHTQSMGRPCEGRHCAPPRQWRARLPGHSRSASIPMISSQCLNSEPSQRSSRANSSVSFSQCRAAAASS
ncbi:hypothetical protein FAGKG844_210003 [Frankia sp. AgKG'84/4]